VGDQANLNPLLKLVGRKVRLGGNGPESRDGKIVAVKSDYLALETKEEGVIYFPLKHLKSIRVDGKDFSDLVAEQQPGELSLTDAGTFNEVLEQMKSRWIQVNRSGPESLQGILTDVYDDQIRLIKDSEDVRLFTFHIKNVSYVRTGLKDDSGSRQNSGQTGEQTSAEATGENEKKPGHSQTQAHPHNDPLRNVKKDKKSRKKRRIRFKKSRHKRCCKSYRMKLYRKKRNKKCNEITYVGSKQIRCTSRETSCPYRKSDKYVVQSVWLSPIVRMG